MVLRARLTRGGRAEPIKSRRRFSPAFLSGPREQTGRRLSSSLNIARSARMFSPEPPLCSRLACATMNDPRVSWPGGGQTVRCLVAKTNHKSETAGVREHTSKRCGLSGYESDFQIDGRANAFARSCATECRFAGHFPDARRSRCSGSAPTSVVGVRFSELCDRTFASPQSKRKGHRRSRDHSSENRDNLNVRRAATWLALRGVGPRCSTLIVSLYPRASGCWNS
jgi:hypothetical protein